MVYGVKESPKGTLRHERAQKDYEEAFEILSSIQQLQSDVSIRDCSRIGKYSPKVTRPLLVRLLRACDASLILRNVTQDALPNGIAIKRYMSPTERQSESILLEQRWKLAQSGVDKTTIKIKGNKLFQDSSIVGKVVDGDYEPTNTPLT